MIAFSTINAHRKQNEVSIRDFWIEVPVEWNGMDGVYLSVPQSSKSFNLCLCQYTLPKLNSFHLMLGACVSIYVKVSVVEYSEKEIFFKTVHTCNIIASRTLTEFEALILNSQIKPFHFLKADGHWSTLPSSKIILLLLGI